MISVAQNKCEYCGAGLMISADSSSYSLRSQSQCPKCGTANDASSWFCLNCNSVLTKNTQLLRRLQRKTKFEIEQMKKLLPIWMQEKLEPGEFIYFVFKLIKKDQFYLVTDKRIVKNQKKYEEILLDETVSLSDIETKIVFLSVSQNFKLNTFQGSVTFGCDELDPKNLGTLYVWIAQAISNYDRGVKDVRTVLLSLDLDAPEESRV